MNKRSRSLTALIICISVIILSCPVSVSGDSGEIQGIFDSGSGTASDPYKIRTKKQLLDFASAVNNGTSFNGKYISLIGDIELNDVSTQGWQLSAECWTPIGINSSVPFKGIFDGQGFAVRGLTVNGADCGGLFGFLDSAEVKNLVLLNAFIDAKEAGGIAASSKSSSITACKSFGEIRGQNAGGIAGLVTNSTVTNCFNFAEINAGENAGGIAYHLSQNSVLSKSINHGDISAGENAAGLAGVCFGSIDYCINTGFVTSRDAAAGIAADHRGRITYSSNHGEIRSEASSGGLCTVSWGEIRNCYNAGAVSADSYSGGIIANCLSSKSVFYCYNAGTVSGIGSKGPISATYSNEGFGACYYLDTCIEDSTNNQGQALTRSDMQKAVSFTDWDFTSTWRIRPSSDYKYPILISAPAFVRVSSVSLSSGEVSIPEGEAVKLIASISPAGADGGYIRFFTDSNDILSVSQDGTVTGLKPGMATVYAASADGGFFDSCTVTVSEKSIPAESIRLNNSELTLNAGESQRLLCEILPEGAECEITWISEKEEIASVSADGVVIAIKEGKTVITASAAGGLSASCTVTVIKPYVPVSGVSLNAEFIELDEATRYFCLTATVFPENATNKNVRWVSSDPTVATVDADGRVYAVYAGEADIIIMVITECGSKTASCRVRVKPLIKRVTSVTVTPAELLMTAGEQKSLTVTVLPEDADDKTVYWFSDSPEIVSVNQNGGITALSEGTATVSATSQDGGLTGYCRVTVMAAPVFVSGVTLNKQSLSLYPDESYRLIASISPENADNKAVVWGSSDPHVARVDQSGVVTGKTAGSAVIIVRTVDGGFTASCNVTVRPKEKNVQSISLNKNALALTVGEAEKLIATILPVDAANKNIVWSSSNLSVASVSQDGVVTALKAGTATIKATTQDKGLSASCTVVVTNPNRSITLAAGSAYKINAENRILYNIKPGTKVSELLKGLGAGSFEVRAADGKLLSVNSVIPTGASISLIADGKAADTLSIAVLGDVNGDGSITAADARLTLRFVAKLETPTEIKRLASDVNGHGVSAADARLILRVVAKLQTL